MNKNCTRGINMSSLFKKRKFRMRKTVLGIRLTALVFFAYSSQLSAEAYAGTKIKLLVNTEGSFSVLTKEDDNNARFIKIRGVVTDSKNSPLPGASVLVRGTKKSVSTGADGSFNIEADVNQVLVISFVGYQTKEITVTNQPSLRIVLQESAIMLDDLVVSVGYGRAKKSDLTGSIASISSKELENVVLNSPDKALQGRVSGVTVRASSHAPGGGVSVNVRGTSSITASGQPLYVIDGFPVSTNFYRPNNVIEGGDAEGNPLAAIDAANIESIEILKDASATAIYGSRGTNGVVIVTTKRGKSGKPKVDFEASVGVRNVSKKFDMLSASAYATLLNEEQVLNKREPIFTQQEINGFGEATDWQDEIFKSALNQRYRLNVSGGNQDIRYLIGTTYDDQDGIVLGTGFKKYAANINLEGTLSPKLKIGTTLNVANTSEQQMRNDTKGSSNWPSMVMNIFRAPLHIPARNENGDPTFFNNFKGGTGEENPLYMAENYDINANTVRLLGSINFTYEITDKLNFKTRVGLDYRDWRNKFYYPIASRSASATLGEAGQYADRTSNVLNENLLEYSNTFGEKHKLNIIGGMTYQRENSEFLSGGAYGFPSDFYSYNNLGIATTPLPGASNRSQWTLLSYLGRINYTFNDKLLITATSRIDGSSKFGANHKYGFFPSGAVAYKFTNEPFIERLKVFSELKLRLGYGHTGNEGIGMYQSMGTIAAARAGANGYIFNNQLVTIAYPTNLPNPDLTWEKARDINLGLDLGFAKNRITANIDLYHKKTTDLLLAVPLPAESGYGSILRNVGSMENKGIEIGLQSRNLTGAFTWTTNANFSINRNKILDLGGADFIFTGWVGGNLSANNGTNVVRLAPGKPVGAFYGSTAEGIWRSAEEIKAVGTMPSAQPGSMRFKDLNGDGLYDAKDDSYIGNPNPDFIYGLSNSFGYKQWSLDIMVYGEYGQDVLWLTKKRLAGGISPVASDRNNRWTAADPNKENATLAANQIYPSVLSTDNTYDASFLRISNISLSYLLKGSQLKLRGLESIRLSLNAENPFLFTNYPGYDPEVNSYGNSNVVKGMDKYAYPSSRLYRLGINVTF
jgi:TonB-linked SusC/RagA family outer membrane protein